MNESVSIPLKLRRDLMCWTAGCKIPAKIVASFVEAIRVRAIPVAAVVFPTAYVTDLVARRFAERRESATRAAVPAHEARLAARRWRFVVLEEGAVAGVHARIR
jgi:hypothetical protein